MSEEKKETMNGDAQAWDKLAKMMENKEVFTVQILETVKAGVVTYVEGIRAFIPASQLSDAYVEDTSEWIDKDVEVRIITCDPETPGPFRKRGCPRTPQAGAQKSHQLHAARHCCGRYRTDHQALWRFC